MMLLIYHPVLMPLLMAILGAIFGSFIAALVARWPQDGSVLAGRSHCEGCGRTLTAHELVPVISWIAQRGKCRTCGIAIGRDAIAIELMAMVIGAGAMLLAPGPNGVLAAIFGWLLLPLAWLDLRHYWLPDRLTLLLAVVGVAFAYFARSAFFIDHLIGGVAGYTLLWLIASGYRLLRGREGLGGGDPKLFGAIGLWLGWQALPFVLLGASGVGLVAALIIAKRGGAIAAESRFPLGALLAFAAWPMIFFIP
jgi:leader peptidase (prepilin peptidase)/N-methyltransferase